MIRRRLLDLAAIAGTLLAIAMLAALAFSFAAPRTVGINRTAWWAPQDLVERVTFFCLDAGRLSHDVVEREYHPNGGNIGPFPSRPLGDARIEQMDYTFVFGGRAPFIRRTAAGRPVVWPTIAVGVVLLGLGAVRIATRGPGPTRQPGRWRRRAPFVIAGTSAVLLVTAIVFCARSFPYFERFDLAVPFVAGAEAIQVNSSRGDVMFAWTRSGPNHTLGGGRFFYVRSTSPAQRGPLWQAAELAPGSYEQALGFTLGSDGGSGLPRNVLIAPYWFVIVMLVAATAGLARLAWRRSRRGVAEDARPCARCGYDLRASPKRCPECGDVATPAAATT